MRVLLGNALGRADFSNDDFAAVGMLSSAREPFDQAVGLSSSDMTDDEVDVLRPDFFRAFAKAAKQAPFIKTHDSYHKNSAGEWLLPEDCSHKAIYIVRNPLDVAVSFAFHRGQDDFEATVKKMNDPEAVLSGQGGWQLRQTMGTWSNHVQSWTQQADIPVLLVRYEDMLHDTAKELSRVVKFLEFDLEDGAEAIERAVAASKFEKLQKSEQMGKFKERPPKAKQFFRSGRRGEGREQLSQRQIDDLLAAHHDMMQNLGYCE